MIGHVKIASYHPRSNEIAERFVDTSKGTLKKKIDGSTMEAVIQQFLQVYPNTVSEMSLAEFMFARKIRSVFDKLLLNTKKAEKK